MPFDLHRFSRGDIEGLLDNYGRLLELEYQRAKSQYIDENLVFVVRNRQLDLERMRPLMELAPDMLKELRECGRTN